MTQNQRSVAPRRAETNTSTHSRQSSTVSEAPLVYDPNSRRMVSRPDLIVREPPVQLPSEKPTRKKRSQAGLGRSGSHLAKGSVARVQGTAVDGLESQQKEATARSATAPVPESEPQSRLESQQPRQDRAQIPGSDQVQQANLLQQEETRAAEPTPRRERVVLSIMPPREIAASVPEFGPEEQEPVKQDVRVTDGATILPSAEPRGPTPILGREEPLPDEFSDDEEDERETIPSFQPTQVVAETTPHNAIDTAPVEALPPLPQAITTDLSVSESPPLSEPAPQAERVPLALRQYGSVRSARPASNSPVRNARFSLTSEQLMVKHEPPPRSVSPRKSALKQSASPSRGASPSDESSEMGGESFQFDEQQPWGRKKSVRVSFDDQNPTVIGEGGVPEQLPDSPVVPSPQQTRRPWYSNIGRSKRKDVAPLLDDDEVMKPRPALPSFGSIREKKPREAEERPLVRPITQSYSPGASEDAVTPSLVRDGDDDEEGDDMVPTGQSSDQKIGSILVQDQVSKNEANTSRFREPLPPVVTSLEGNGYYSASSSEDERDSSSEQEPDFELHAAQEPALESIQEMPREPSPEPSPERTENKALSATPGLRIQADPAEGSAKRNGGETHAYGGIPQISVIGPSPGVKELPEDEQANLDGGYFDVPGSFPEEEFHDTNASAASPQDGRPTPKIITNIPAVDTHISPPSSPSSKAPQVSTITEENSDESSSDSGIYSDAYEDLSDVDEGGFMSLDAVITTPVSEKISRRLLGDALSTSPKHETREEARDERVPEAELLPNPPGSSGLPQPPANGPITEDEWEKAKAYWKGLSADKRKHLEQEALEEAGAEADQEDVVQTVKGTQKKHRPTSINGFPQRQSMHERTYQIDPGTKVPDSPEEVPSHRRRSLRGVQAQPKGEDGGRLRKSMRASQPAAAPVTTAGASASTMRRSLRGNEGAEEAPGHRRQASAPEGRMRTSMRQNGAAPRTEGVLQKQTQRTTQPRPMSMPQAPASHTLPGKQKRQASLDTPAVSAGAAGGNKPSLRRRGSDSSESSFKRARPQRQGLGFRRSMRGASPERPAEAHNKSSRFSLRSLSPPPASPPPTSMGNRMSLRSTLRSDSSDGGSAHRMRVSTFGRLTGKKAGGKPKKGRFEDSSDDEDVRPSTFQSRYADSSDEEEAPAARPASRGLPKSMRNGASGGAAKTQGAAVAAAPPKLQTDMAQDDVSEELPDSSDEEQGPPPQRTASGRVLEAPANDQSLRHKRSGRGDLAASATSPVGGTQGSFRPPEQRKGGFLSVLRRKKDTSSRISRGEPRESGARLDTNLERSSEQLSALRNTPASPKLQKMRSPNWPLADPGSEEPKRPSTAGNAAPTNGTVRGSLSKRRASAQAVPTQANPTPPVPSLPEPSVATPDHEETPSQADASVKKKKFGKLRKMFGLND